MQVRCRRRARGRIAATQLSDVHSGLGNSDRAMDWLERAVVERAAAMYGIKGSSRQLSQSVP